MNWKLVFQLSLFGLAMALGTVFLIPSSIEPLCWLVIFLVCAYLVARNGQKPFLHGLAIGIANSVWVTVAHILFFDQYLSGHAQEAAMMKSMPMPESPRLMMALTGPVVGVVSGVIIGILCVVASKLVKPAPISGTDSER